MDEIRKHTYKDWLWRIAIFIMVVCLIEGFVYYKDTENIVLMIALNIQNAIKAYKIDPDIKIEDAIKFINNYPDSYLIQFISYLYVFVVIIAPFCTVAALMTLVKTPFEYLRGLKNRNKKKTLLIIGEGENKKNFIETTPGGDCKVISIENGVLDDKTRIDYLSRGIRAIIRYKKQSMTSVLSKAKIEYIENILICDDDPMQCLVQLKNIAEYYKKTNVKSSIIQRVYLVCDEIGISNIIKKYYDELTSEFGKNKRFDLYIIDIKKQAINVMFNDNPIYTYNQKKILLDNEIKEDSFDVHMAILGFGDYGQKTLIEAINQSIFAPDSNIVFDIYDKNIASVLGTFMKRFSPFALDELVSGDEDGLYKSFVISGDNTESRFSTDGKLIINFWGIDVDTLEFTKVFESNHSNFNYTYIVVAMDTERRMAAAVVEIDRLISISADKELLPTIVVRTRGDGDEYSLLRHGNTLIIPYSEKKTVYDFAEVIKTDIVDQAKIFNYRYNMVYDLLAENFENYTAEDYIALLEEDDSVILSKEIEVLSKEVDVQTMEEIWLGTDFYGRESSTAQSMHQCIKQWLYGEDTEDTSDDSRRIHKIIAGSGTAYNSKEYKERIEHRRWNLFAIMVQGQAYAPKRDKARKLHHCIVTYDALKRNNPDLLEYDYTPYVMLNK